MNIHQTVAAVARRLPHQTHREVQEVLEVLAELWQAELAAPPSEVNLIGLGKLYLETHRVKCAGVMRTVLEARSGTAPAYLQRRVIRFRPSQSLQDDLSRKETAHD